MQTTDIGRSFFHVIRVRPDTPLKHRAITVEIEPPYRRSNSLILRLTPTRALVLGWWTDTEWDAEDALTAAVQGWGIDPYSDSLEDPETKQIIRENIAAQSKDLDSEWTIVQALGVDA